MTNTIPENVLVAFRYAQALWPHDVSPGSEAVALAWSPTLAAYSVDELCRAFDEFGRTHTRLPELAEMVAALREQRRLVEKANTPRLPAKPGSEGVVHPSANPYRAKLRADLVKFWRRADGTVDPDKLAEIDAEVAQVGEREAALLRQHGIDVPETMPPATRPFAADVAQAGAVLMRDEPSPRSTDEIAESWWTRWKAAGSSEREALRSESDSFTHEVCAAVRRLRDGEKVA